MCVFLQKKGLYSRMQDSEEFSSLCGQNKQHATLKPRSDPELPREEEPNAAEEERCKETQPAETEYLSSRCVVFTYFRGDIGDVVDEHFTRALSQPSTFSNDVKTSRLHTGGPWKGRKSQCYTDQELSNKKQYYYASIVYANTYFYIIYRFSFMHNMIK